MTTSTNLVILNTVKDLKKKQILRCTQNDKTANPDILNAVKELNNYKKYL